MRFRFAALAQDTRGRIQKGTGFSGVDTVSIKGEFRSNRTARIVKRNFNSISGMIEPKQFKNTGNNLSTSLNAPPRMSPFYHSKPIQKAGSSKIVHPLILSNVKIQLYKGNKLKKTIVENTGNNGSSGSYQWQEVDPSLSDGTDYKIRVLSATDSSIYGESDSFEIGVGNFDERFDDNTNVKNFWKTTNFPNLWTVTDGVYKKKGKGANVRTASYYDLGDYADFTFEAKCGNESTTNVWYGLAVRGSENFSTYYFFYVGIGLYQIIKHDNGVDDRLTGQSAHSAINTGTNHWNKLKVEANGKTFNFYINDHHVYTIALNDAPDKGRIGLVTRANYENVKFDDVAVRVIR